MVVLDRQLVWSGTRLHPVDICEVEATCVHLAGVYKSTFVLDPWQSAQLAQNLRRRRIRVKEFAFGQQSVGRLAQRLFGLLREHALDLPDDDQELLDELANVRIKETSPGVFRMDHDSGRHDDRAISLALAANELLERATHIGPRMRYRGARRPASSQRLPEQPQAAEEPDERPPLEPGRMRIRSVRRHHPLLGTPNYIDPSFVPDFVVQPGEIA